MSKITKCENCINNTGEFNCTLHPELCREGSFCSDGIIDKSKNENIIIYSPKVARKLLKNNFKIVDIKPDRSNPVRTVFVFKIEDGLLEIVNDSSEDKVE